MLASCHLLQFGRKVEYQVLCTEVIPDFGEGWGAHKTKGVRDFHVKNPSPKLKISAKYPSLSLTTRTHSHTNSIMGKLRFHVKPEIA
jgi:hypothetical protein